MPAGEEVTVPDPLPTRLTESLWSGRVKLAWTVRANVTDTVHRFPLAAGQLDHPVNVEFVAALAVSVTVVPLR